MSFLSGAARKAKEQVSGLDFSRSLAAGSGSGPSDDDDARYSDGAEVFRVGRRLVELGLGAQLTAMAYDPVQGLLAVGTEHGKLYVFGGPGVELSWNVSPMSNRVTRVKHLAFKSSSGFLVAVDSKDTLFVFDLSRRERDGTPTRDATLSMRSVITSMEVHPSLSHVFLGGTDGTVDVFDIDAGKLVPKARVPNLWLAAEELARRSNMEHAKPKNHVPACTDVKLHPLDLSQLLVAYEGGVALWSLTEKRTLQSWDFILMPGAPGGGNFEGDDLFTERYQAVMCLAWRPDGQMFAVGHDDGSFSFCTPGDEQPISTRTLDREDVTKASEEDLFGWGAQKETLEDAQGAPHSRQMREPVFRLAWTGFPEEGVLDKVRQTWFGGSPKEAIPDAPLESGAAPSTHGLKGETFLTIMGALLPKDPSGIHCFEMPAYVPATKPNSGFGASQPAPRGETRRALLESVKVQQHAFYPINMPQDFILLPRSPYHGNAFDPTGIVITSGMDDTCYRPSNTPFASDTVSAYSFPPTSHSPPRELQLPGRLQWSGDNTCLSCRLVNVSDHTYDRIYAQSSLEEDFPAVELKGGKALPRLRNRDGTRPLEIPARLLLSTHSDLTVRFWDVSDHLLESKRSAASLGPDDPLRDAAFSGRVASEYPKPLPHLTFDIRRVLRHGSASSLAAARVLRENPADLRIADLSFAAETFEMAVVLSCGDVVLARFGHELSSSSHPPAVNEEEALAQGLDGLAIGAHQEMAPQLDETGTILDITRASERRFRSDSFHPVMALRLNGHFESSVALSNIGFLAVSRGDHVVIVNLREGGEILFNDSVDAGTKEKSKKQSSISSLKWTVCVTNNDSDASVRLLASRRDGFTRVFELANAVGSWLLPIQKALTLHDKDLADLVGSFVFARDGSQSTAHPLDLQAAVAAADGLADVHPKGSLRSLWVTVSPNLIATHFNVDGPQTFNGKAELNFCFAAIVSRHECPVLVLLSRKDHMLRVFALPSLAQITRLTLSPPISHLHEGTICEDGDWVDFTSPLDISISTLFDFSRPAYPSSVELHNTDFVLPAQPGVSVTRFFAAKGILSGAELDALLGGGPERMPPKERRPLGDAKPLSPKLASSTSSQHRAAAGPTWTERLQAQQTSLQGSLSQTTEALNQRGEILTGLQDRLNAVAKDTRDFAVSAKKTAQQEAAKRSIKDGVSSLWK